MNNNWYQLIEKNRKYLDEKKPQTTYKIKYIVNYVEKWLFVQCNVKENKNINFVDCMCNAGIYSDGDKGTSINVLELFNRFALEHKDKVFNLVLNDISTERLNIIKDIVYNYIGCKADNIHIYFYNQDVNEFLKENNIFNSIFNCYPDRAANLVFVDPYNFCTVKLSILKTFLVDKYCELLFNVFTSDFVRNQDKPKMRAYCMEENIIANTKDEMVECIKERLRVGKIEYVFSYEFKTITKNEIYQIMFFTPNTRGLEKLKEALWETFNGKEFHRNEKKQEYVQLTMFTEEDDRNWMTKQHSNVAKDKVLKFLMNKTVTFAELEIFILENTILRESQIIDNVLKPLIENKRILKLGKVKNKSNYKKDEYKILG